MHDNSELYHWGIKGMKWGVRRYQNKDGTLTNAGKKHYSKEMEKLRAESKVITNKKRTADKFAKLEEQRKKNNERLAEIEDRQPSSNKNTTKEPTKKSISQMTDDELTRYKQRLQLEKDTYDLQTKISQLNPSKESAAKKMIENYGPVLVKAIWNDVAKPSLNKYLEKNLQIEKPLSELDKLKKEASIWEQKAKIAENKKKHADDTEKYEQGVRRRKEQAEAEENRKKDQKDRR